MRYAHPLQRQQIVDHEARIVGGVQVAVDGAQRVVGERPVRFGDPVALALEGGKERLAVDGASDGFELVVEQSRLGVIVGGDADQVIQQQQLVDGGGDLSATKITYSDSGKGCFLEE